MDRLGTARNTALHGTARILCTRLVAWHGTERLSGQAGKARNGTEWNSLNHGTERHAADAAERWLARNGTERHGPTLVVVVVVDW